MFAEVKGHDALVYGEDGLLTWCPRLRRPILIRKDPPGLPISTHLLDLPPLLLNVGGWENASWACCFKVMSDSFGYIN
jgi:hypothetical protein